VRIKCNQKQRITRDLVGNDRQRARNREKEMGEAGRVEDLRFFFATGRDFGSRVSFRLI
jgi:hypothetical protein